MCLGVIDNFYQELFKDVKQKGRPSGRPHENINYRKTNFLVLMINIAILIKNSS